jgi:hypothetical protein
MSDKKYLSKEKCKCCGQSLNKVGKRNTQRVSDSGLISRLNNLKKTVIPKGKSFDIEETIERKDLVCKRCITYANSYYSGPVKSRRSRSQAIQREIENPYSRPRNISESNYDNNECNTIELNIPRTISTHSRCVICPNSGKIISVPKEAYFDTFIKKDIIIPNG